MSKGAYLQDTQKKGSLMEMVDMAQSLQSIVSIVHALKSLTGKARQQGVSDEFTSELKTVIMNLQDAAIEAQSMTLEAQGEQSRLLARVAELEREIKRAGDWANERQRYELVYLGNRVVYGLREESRQEDEPVHYLCTTCYEEGNKSILQPHGFAAVGKCLKCGPI